MKKVLVATLLLAMTVFGASAQKISGSLAPLKGQKQVNVVLDFTGTLVNGKPEESHVEFFSRNKTEEEIEKWRSEWYNDLRNQSYAMFVRDLNNKVSKKHFTVGNFPEAGYTIVVNVRDITPGFFAGVMTKPSAVRADISFVKTGETKPFATTNFKRVSSSASSSMPYFVTRIALSFGSLGLHLGNSINKALK